MEYNESKLAKFQIGGELGPYKHLKPQIDILYKDSRFSVQLNMDEDLYNSFKQAIVATNKSQTELKNLSIKEQIQVFLALPEDFTVRTYTFDIKEN